MISAFLSFFLVLGVTATVPAWHSHSPDPVGALAGERIAHSRHYVFTPESALSSSEQAQLSGRGIEVMRPLTKGRYLVRVAPDVPVDGRFERLTPEKKIHRAALRAAASGKPFVNVNVLFHDDVPFEAARALIAAAGGMLQQPLQFDFEIPNRIPVRIPSTALIGVAGDERVLLVHGPVALRPEIHNIDTARLSGVTDLHEPPYGLTGRGVVLSFFEFAPADTTHPEFQGRLTTHLSGTSGSDIEHATHVTGTMIAAGIDSRAKGMAPKATVHQFSAHDDDFLSVKERLRSMHGVSADNNSWGYVLGWWNPPSGEGWVWLEFSGPAEFYGGYDSWYVAPLDKITRSSGMLMVHSAGNDAQKRGPQAAPFPHKHDDADGKITSSTFCYSADGSGMDCPTPTCSTGRQYCETVRHAELSPEYAPPYGSIGLMASAKNVISVGAVHGSGIIAGFSSRGPARDGRVKPDLVARGVGVYSTIQNNAYATKPGTSMAAPAVTGMAALLTEQWRRTYNGQDPTPATLKTLLIAGAQDLGNAGPDYTYGFGLAHAKNAVDLIIADGGRGRRVKSHGVANGASFEVPVTVPAGHNLRVVVGWSDPEVVIFPSDGLATTALVNDLDLKVITPSGETVLPYVLDKQEPTQPATRGVNNIDNTEVVEIGAAAAGVYRVVVSGTRITAQSPQQFVLIANAEMEANAPPCIEIDEPNNTEATAVSLARRTTIFGRTCAADDVDFFGFTVNEPGTISVTVTTTGTPLRVTLSGGGSAVDVPAGQSRTLTLPYASAAATTFHVRVAAAGAVGDDATYSIVAEYPFRAEGRRRSAGR